MKIFLLDLWNDLRAKRLWPVALVLLAGLVAVPVLLAKPAEAPSAPAPAATTARTAPEPDEFDGLASVKLEEDGTVGGGSALDTFDPSNPFRPPSKVVEEGEQESEAGSAGPGVTLEESGSLELPDSTGGGTSTGTPDSTTTPTVPDPGDDTPPDDGDEPKQTTQFTYVVDLTFTANGRTRKLKSLERLDMLPNEASPLLIFLGVSANAGNAVFLVDSTLTAAGEGSCKPDGGECAFLHIGAGSEHEFTNDQGDSYTLRIDEIRKVKVGGKASSSRSKRGKRATAAVGRPAESRRFVAPIIADLVSVSSGADAGSNRDRDRR